VGAIGAGVAATGANDGFGEGADVVGLGDGAGVGFCVVGGVVGLGDGWGVGFCVVGRGVVGLGVVGLGDGGSLGSFVGGLVPTRSRSGVMSGRLRSTMFDLLYSLSLEKSLSELGKDELSRR